MRHGYLSELYACAYRYKLLISLEKNITGTYYQEKSYDLVNMRIFLVVLVHSHARPNT